MASLGITVRDWRNPPQVYRPRMPVTTKYRYLWLLRLPCRSVYSLIRVS